jgi:hypothetical protein
MSIIQIISMGFAIGLLILAVRRIIYYPKKLFLKLPIIFLSMHVLLFYAYVYIRDAGLFSLTNLTSSDWSSVLRLHAMLTYCLLELFGYARDRDREKRKE